MTLAGFPATILFAGTSFFTTALAAMTALSPTLTLPNTFAPAKTTTLSPKVGTPSFFAEKECPKVTPCRIVQFLPILQLSAITIFEK